MMLDVRWHRREHWGVRAPRRTFDDAHWRQPLRWNSAAQAAGVRRRVFCASMADVFDNAVDQASRDRLWSVIRDTPRLDWVVLTKRIGNALKMLPDDWAGGYPNVWLVISADQAELDRDAPKLLDIPAAVHGISVQPQLAPVRLGKFARRLQWVINGGESGAGARPFHLEWARALIAECSEAAMPIFVQRLGAKPFEAGQRLRLTNRAGADLAEWPADLRVRQWPIVSIRSAA
jgi:protein gp37